MVAASNQVKFSISHAIREFLHGGCGVKQLLMPKCRLDGRDPAFQGRALILRFR
jgi:hypothetical protein